jgi:hypothetical protein
MKSILLALGILTSLQGFSDELISQEELLTVPIEEKTQTEPNQKEIPPWLNQLWIIPGFVSFYLLGKDSKVTDPKIEFNPKIQVHVDKESNRSGQPKNEEELSQRVFDEKDKDLELLFSIRDAEDLETHIISSPINIFAGIERLLEKKLNASTFIIQIMDYLESEKIQTDKKMQQALSSEGYEHVEQMSNSKVVANSESIVLSALYKVLVDTENIFASYFDDEYRAYISSRVDSDLLKDRSIVTEQEQRQFLENLYDLKMSRNRSQKPIKHSAIDFELTDEEENNLINKTHQKMPKVAQLQFITRTTGLFVFVTDVLYPEAPFLKDFTKSFLIGNHTFWIEKVTQEFRRIQKSHTP